MGAVIEEDGKTEEEFVETLIELNREFSFLSSNSRSLEEVIAGNISKIAGEG